MHIPVLAASGGTLSGLLDASGGLAAMAFHFSVGHLASADQWISFLGILSAASLLGFLAMSTFQRITLPKTTDLSNLLRGSTGNGKPRSRLSLAQDLGALLTHDVNPSFLSKWRRGPAKTSPTEEQQGPVKKRSSATNPMQQEATV